APRRSARAGQESAHVSAAALVAGRGRLAGRTALPDDTAQHIRAGGARARRSRHLRSDGLLGRPALARDRYSHGTRSGYSTRAGDGGRPRFAPRRGRCGLGVIGALAATRVLPSFVHGASTPAPLTLARTARVL